MAEAISCSTPLATARARPRWLESEQNDGEMALGLAILGWEPTWAWPRKPDNWCCPVVRVALDGDQAQH